MDVTSIPFTVALLVSLLAGIISFISPCVLPLIPAYVSYMGGRVTHKVAAQVSIEGGQATIAVPLSTRFSTFAHGVAFVLGFTLVFVTFGLLTTAFIGMLGGSLNLVTTILARVGGIVIIFFGLHFMGILPVLFARSRGNPARLDLMVSGGIALVGSIVIVWAFVEWIIALPVLAVFWLWLLLGRAFTHPKNFWLKVIATLETALYADTRRQVTATGNQGLLGSAFLGIVFAAGWTPCVGPVYGAALNLAITGTGANITMAGVLLTAYSLGLGIPFLVTTLLLESVQGVLRRLQRHMHKVELASGALLIFIGVVVATGRLQVLVQNMQSSTLADLSVQIETNMVNTVTGAMPVPTTQPVPTVAPTAQALNTNAVDSFTSLVASGSGPGMGLNLGDAAPNFKTVTDAGDPFALSDLRGKVVVLNFWFTECGPCRIEMPEFQRIYSEHGGEDITILAVNRQDLLEKVEKFRDDFGLTFPIAMDPQASIQKEYRIPGYPTTFILNPQGVIVARQYGPLTVEQIRQLVNSALAG